MVMVMVMVMVMLLLLLLLLLLQLPWGGGWPTRPVRTSKICAWDCLARNKEIEDMLDILSELKAE